MGAFNDERTARAIERLNRYKQLLDEDIEGYVAQFLKTTEEKYTPQSVDAVKAYCDILSRGGKRLRGALVMNAYEMLGGEDEQLVVHAGRVIEMAHAHMLIIDDIADESDTRRGGITAHRQLETYHSEHHLQGDDAHFGEAVAMNAGVMGLYAALSELGRLNIDDTTKLEAMNNLNDILIVTMHGQFNDIFAQKADDVSEAHVLDTLRWKTAYYTFLNPLQMGAILAKADQSELGCLYEYSMNMGLSFQITDDILGTFGNEFESGKSAKDDIKEGKMTILVARALARADANQKQNLLAALGNRELSESQYKTARQVIDDTGALDYAHQLAEKHAEEAILALESAPRTWRQENVDFLRGLAAYVVTRKV